MTCSGIKEVLRSQMVIKTHLYSPPVRLYGETHEYRANSK